MNDIIEQNLELVKTLKDGHMNRQPAVKILIAQAMNTGDFSPLKDFLQRHPGIMGMAMRNIQAERIRKLSCPVNLPTPWDFRERLDGPIKIGYLDEARNYSFGLDNQALVRHIAATGSTGRGKTECLRRLAHSIVSYGRNLTDDVKTSTIIIDPAKQEYRGFSNIFPETKFITSEQLRINPFKPHPFLTASEQRIMVADLMSRIFMGQMITRSQLIAAQEYMNKHFSGGGMRILRKIMHEWQLTTKTYGMADILAKIVARLDLLLECEVFDCVEGNPFSTFTNHDLLVLELDGIESSVQAFITAYIIRSLYLHNLRTDRGKGRINVVICEETRELQNHPDRKEWGDSAWDQDISRVRAANIALVCATQEPGTLSDTTASNCYTKIAFSAQSGKDFETVQKGWSLDDEQTNHIPKLKIGQAIVRFGGHPEPILIHVPLLEMPGFVSDEEMARRMSGFWSDLRAHVVTENRLAADPPKPPQGFNPDGGFVLKTLSAQPFLTRSELQQAVKGYLSRENLDAALSWLQRHSLLLPKKISLHGRKPATFYEIQKAALKLDGIQSAKGSGSYRHRLFQHYLREWSEERGNRAQIEGVPDTRTGKRVDVLVTEPDGCLVALEVTCSLDNVVHNCNEDFRSGVCQVVVVCPDAETRDRAMYLVNSSPQLVLRGDAIDFRLIWEMKPNTD